VHTASPVSFDEIGATRVRSLGILSTFPPTSCGIATFSASRIDDGASVNVVRCGPAPDIEDVLGVIASITAPVVVVVMAETARQRLLNGFDVERSKVHLIPHGVATPLAAPSVSQRRHETPPRLLTWGLLGPGKGIEWAIDAMAELRDIDRRPEYVIAGATPRKFANDRARPVARCWSSALRHHRWTSCSTTRIATSCR